MYSVAQMVADPCTMASACAGLLTISIFRKALSLPATRSLTAADPLPLSVQSKAMRLRSEIWPLDCATARAPRAETRTHKQVTRHADPGDTVEIIVDSITPITRKPVEYTDAAGVAPKNR